MTLRSVGLQLAHLQGYGAVLMYDNYIAFDGEWITAIYRNKDVSVE